MYLLAAGVFAASGQAACVALKVGGVAVAAGVADDLAQGVVAVAVVVAVGVSMRSTSPIEPRIRRVVWPSASN